MSVQIPMIQVDPGVKLVSPPAPPDQLQTYLTVVDDKIILDFQRIIRWVAFEPAQMEKLANEMLEAVRAARTLYVPPED